MSSLFIEYPKCTTCQKAKKWLDEQGVSYEDRHIVEQNPTAEELRTWIEESGLPSKRFFNTSGLLYKSMNLKDRLPGMSLEEQVALLAIVRVSFLSFFSGKQIISIQPAGSNLVMKRKDT